MNTPSPKYPVLLQTGFRVFFLGAALYSVVSMFIWMVFYVGQVNIFVAMPLTIWHAHEMIYGFSMAVIAGFLLTAVTNWTGLPTLNGVPLLILFSLWCSARVLAFLPAGYSLVPLMFCNAAFMIFLCAGVMRPIIQVKQWRQSAVFSKIILIFLSAVFMYGGLLSANLAVERKSLRFAVYMIISLILTISRRVMPFFIERGVGYAVTLRNNRMVDLAGLALIVLLSLIDTFFFLPVIVSILSGLLALTHLIRLSGWYTPGIWRKPLLWVLFTGYAFIIAGFILKTFLLVSHRFEDAALHAFTAGGIGVFALGMMARVAWGHTGRNIAEPPRSLPVLFGMITASAVIRVFFTLGNDNQYGIWISLGQLLWISAFILYLLLYTRVLISARADGQWG